MSNRNTLPFYSEVIEQGLRLACYLGKAEIALLTWAQTDWILRDRGGVEIFSGRPPSEGFILEFPLVAEGEVRGSLRLYSNVAQLERESQALRDCVEILARSLFQQSCLHNSREMTERYRDFINEISEGVWRCELRQPMPKNLPPDEQVTFVFDHGYMAECNPAMARMYGFERAEEIVGAPLTDLLLVDEPRNHLYLESFVRNGYQMRNAESIEKDRDGNVRYFVNNLVGIVCADFVYGAWGTQTEITAYKNLETRLTEAAAAAAEANKAKSAFLANISHEIRTPLGVILGFADLALDKPDLSADTKGYISSIRRNGEQLSEILGEVLDMSKIEASRMEIEEIRFPLVPMLSEVVTFLDLHAREKGLALSLDKVGPLPKAVKTDPTRLRQILTNLISNAIKFTEAGFVKVGVRMVSPAIAGTPLQLEFTVSDSGIGISKEMGEKLFRPFIQAEASTARRYGGTGLGLHLSKQLANALGGDLTLQASDAGHGCTFLFTVAAGTFDGELMSDAKSSSVGPSVPQPFENAQDREVFEGKRVLLIEDSEDNQTLIKHYLSAVGIQVEVANNGFDGLEKIAGGEYDLIVLDIQMPGMDGHEVAKNLREQGYSQPIIALTAHAFKEEREKAFRNGFNEYLTKPINRMMLLKTLSNRLGSPALH